AQQVADEAAAKQVFARRAERQRIQNAQATPATERGGQHRDIAVAQMVGYDERSGFQPKVRRNDLRVAHQRAYREVEAARRQPGKGRMGIEFGVGQPVERHGPRRGRSGPNQDTRRTFSPAKRSAPPRLAPRAAGYQNSK